MNKITRMKRAVRTLTVMAGMCVVCLSAATAFAGEEIMLKDVNSTNYNQYVKPMEAAYGYNKGECRREYLPHEEHFYSEYYDHWNVDVVYDSALVKKLYTDFENAKPEIEHITKDSCGICIGWKGVKDVEKYVISVKYGKDKWRVLDIVDGRVCSYVDRTVIENGKTCRYKVQGIKHVRLWDVKTRESGVIVFANSI